MSAKDQPPRPATGPLRGTRKLSASPSTQKHVEALAEKIMNDPSFPLLHETARKMAEKHQDEL